MSWEVVVLATKDAPARRLRVDHPTPRKVLRVAGINVGHARLCYGDLIVDLDEELNPEACLSGAWWYAASKEHGGTSKPLFLVKSPADSQPYLKFLQGFRSVSMFVKRIFAGV